METLKHECGIAVVRLLKPLEYYHEKYGTWMYGLNKLYLLMEKQHNRGQEGAGMACVKLNANPGEEYLFIEKATGTDAITEIFGNVQKRFKNFNLSDTVNPYFAKERLPFAGECYMGHLRYSTTGKSGLEYVHPMVRRNNWRAKNLAICGNFNLTNIEDVFQAITSRGQHPRHYSDTHILLEQIGHRLDREVERLYRICKSDGMRGMDITNYIEANIEVANALKFCSPLWDGGYVMCGLTGSGESYAMRDPWGIRPAFYHMDDEIVVVASERPVIQTALNVPAETVNELQPGTGIFIDRNGKIRFTEILQPKIKKSCSFERIYFSRGSDKDIYRERKKLGRNLVAPILKSIDGDLEHSVFSFIPNTAEVAYYGMIEGIREYLDKEKIRKIENRPDMNGEELEKIIRQRVRTEKVAIKDIKLRTFIAEGKSREELAAHVYDITYGTIKPGIDNLVIIDDSIVRGTTLKQSIIGILDRLRPRKIVIVSSSPQIRYPDCYGIDMAQMTDFIAFKAAVELLKDRKLERILWESYEKAKKQRISRPEDGIYVNYVKAIYEPFTIDEISRKMVELLRPAQTKAEVEIVFQDLKGLHSAIPEHEGDWYFSGDYPTPGGAKMVNNAFIDYMEKDFKN